MIRVGLIGFGLAGRVFHAPLISSVEGLELASVLERSSDNGAQRYPGITTHRTLDAMLADSSLGLIVVATPNGTHYDLARQALEAGKSVVVDKPVAITSSEIASLIELAEVRKSLLIPFHNRRWDSDFLTLTQLANEQAVGRMVSLESTFDRWRPISRGRAWKEEPTQGGMLLDIGTHLADQALRLFGLPQTVSADIQRERDGEGPNDSFTLRLRFNRMTVTLAANVLSAMSRPRYHLRGTRGNYVKWGLDPQEAALSKITHIPDGPWGEESAENWGTLKADVDGELVSRAVQPIGGDYRIYYAGVRDALLGKCHAPVSAIAAWRTARLLEWAVESAQARREVLCDWACEPKSNEAAAGNLQ